MARVIRERINSLQRKRRKLSVPNVVRRFFGRPPANVSLFRQALEHLETQNQLVVNSITITNEERQSARDLELAVNDLFRRFQEKERIVLAVDERVDADLLRVWGEAWRPRIKGIKGIIN